MQKKHRIQQLLFATPNEVMDQKHHYPIKFLERQNEWMSLTASKLYKSYSRKSGTKRKLESPDKIQQEMLGIIFQAHIYTKGT